MYNILQRKILNVLNINLNVNVKGFNLNIISENTWNKLFQGHIIHNKTTGNLNGLLFGNIINHLRLRNGKRNGNDSSEEWNEYAPYNCIVW